jgi:hypothetical protein
LPSCAKKAQAPIITKFAIGKNANSDPPANSYEVAEVIYATAKVSTPPGKYNINFVVTAQNVEERDRGEQIMNKSLDLEGEQPLFMHFSIAYPGNYTVSAILSDTSGHQLDTKSEDFVVTGEAPTFQRDHERKKAEEQEREKGEKDGGRK